MPDEQKDIVEENDEVEAHQKAGGGYYPADSAPKNDPELDEDNEVEAHYKAHTP